MTEREGLRTVSTEVVPVLGAAGGGLQEAVAEQRALSFAGLLRQLRAEARLTQEELAEAAGVSPRSVSDLERGIHPTAHKDTALLLAGALSLDGPARELFVAAARGKAPAAEVLAARGGETPGAVAARALPRDIAGFTGRHAELAQLMGGLADAAANGGVVGIHAVDGMAGIGKTTFAVHAAHQLAGSFPDGQYFLPLHAHTPGHRPVHPADALASLLLTAGVAAPLIPPGLEARTAHWRDHTAGKRVLLLLDDATGHEQVRPLLPGTPGSLVLITSRRRLAALADATVITLDPLAPGEAAGLLVRLAARPGMRTDDGAVQEIARLGGYLPLALGMLASQLRHHPSWTPAELAGSLTAARDRLELMKAENLSVAAAFGLSYADLTVSQQRLFRRLGLIPGPTFDAHAAAALDSTSLESARRDLAGLYDQHLLTEPAPGRYLLHDLLREHARMLAAAEDSADREAATGRLLDYYLHTALAAGRHITSWNLDEDSLPRAHPPECAPPLATPGQAALWLEAERLNLHAAVVYAASAGLARYASLIPAAIAGFLENSGYWDQARALHQIALTMARQAGDRPGQARALMLHAAMQTMTCEWPAAAATLRQALALYRELGDRVGEATAINSLGETHRQTGDCRAALSCHQQALKLFRELGDRRGQAETLIELGNAQSEVGSQLAAASHRQALGLYRDLGHRWGQVQALINLGGVQLETGDYPAAAASYQQAQELNKDPGNREQRIWILCLFGVLHRLAGEYAAAAASCQQALEQFRDIGSRLGEADALNELGLIQQQTGDYAAATVSHQQALQIDRDTGHRRGQAQDLNSLGELYTHTRHTSQARDHHNQALVIARDIPVPGVEARALEGIGTSYLHDGNPSQAVGPLQQALTIYQRIGMVPDVQRVQETLRVGAGAGGLWPHSGLGQR